MWSYCAAGKATFGVDAAVSSVSDKLHSTMVGMATCSQALVLRKVKQLGIHIA